MVVRDTASALASTADEATQVFLRPHQSWAFTQTERLATSVTNSYTQTARPRLPWSYSYAQFGALLNLYPDIHPEDFVTFGVLHDQPRRGSLLEWRDAAGVLSHMVGGRLLLVNQLFPIIRRIQRLHAGDPTRAAEEEALVAIVMGRDAVRECP